MEPSSERNVESLKELYRLWKLTKGTSTKPWLDLLGDRVVFRSVGAGDPAIEFSRDGTTAADVRRYFEDLARDWEMLDYEVERMIAQDDCVAVLARCSWRNRHTGKTASSLKADFFRFDKGRVVEFTEFFDTAGAVAAATP
jgi:ketosteroid isomerase-like protein